MNVLVVGTDMKRERRAVTVRLATQPPGLSPFRTNRREFDDFNRMIANAVSPERSELDETGLLQNRPDFGANMTPETLTEEDRGGHATFKGRQILESGSSPTTVYAFCSALPTNCARTVDYHSIIDFC